MGILLNKGPRTWDLHDGIEVDGKVVRRKARADGSFDPADKVIKRKLLPGKSIEALDEKEFKDLLDHKFDIVDADKVMPQQADKVKTLEAEVERLKGVIAELEERIAKGDGDGDQDPEKKGGKKKGQ